MRVGLVILVVIRCCRHGRGGQSGDRIEGEYASSISVSGSCGCDESVLANKCFIVEVSLRGTSNVYLDYLSLTSWLVQGEVGNGKWTG